jgi:putative transposase
MRVGPFYTKHRPPPRSYAKVLSTARCRPFGAAVYTSPLSLDRHPRYIAQENGNFNNVHVWTYGLLLRRIREVAEEYGIKVIYVDEAGTSSRCPLHGDGCGIRVYRGLFKCTQLNEIFNADIAAARNILRMQVTEDVNNPRAPKRGGGNGRRPGQGLNPQRGDVAQTSPHQMGRRSF